jgi:methenyltetrahydromethanopterin cyclohydrolase
MLFSPARAIVTAVETGETFHAGGIDQTLLDVSFG